MKIVIEIPDEDAKLVAEAFDLDINKLVNNWILAGIKNLKAVAILHKTGVKLDLEKIREMGNQLGSEVFKTSHKEH